ncbi:MAG: N-acetylmuramoyl-L-alanine amidase [Anaerocolumna sp.]|jgi:N-acetylmuramoyl-L-alanine amidase|nr:N-acetylmuramoyl-L-alanine amidase [Anaerocolumna sp.]
MAYKVVIDAGHGGYDSGAVYNGRLEKNDNLDLAIVVGDILAYNGVDVLFTRTEDIYIAPLERAYMANEEDADLFVSIHRNSSSVPGTYSGVQTLVYSEEGLQQQVAENINAEMEELGFTNLGTDVRTDLAVLRRTNMPSLLTEIGFINTESDNALLDERFEDIAYGIASGILDALNMDDDVEVNEDEYHIQIGLFRIPSNAENLQENLRMAGYDVSIVPQGDLFAVQVGNFSNLDEALELEQELRLQGYSTLVVKD